MNIECNVVAERYDFSSVSLKENFLYLSRVQNKPDEVPFRDIYVVKTVYFVDLQPDPH